MATNIRLATPDDALGVQAIYAPIVRDTSISFEVGLHESLGFQPVGVYRAVGYTLGAWHDVGWWQRSLRPQTVPPAPPIPLTAACTYPAWHAALATGAPFLQR